MSLITSETARQMGAKGAEARRRKKAEREIDLRALRAAVAARNELLERSPAVSSTALEEEHADSRARKVQRLETQLDRLDDMLDKEEDPTKLDRLASARSRIFEMWRVLANIPLPGSKRPARDKPAARPPLPPVIWGDAEQPEQPVGLGE